MRKLDKDFEEGLFAGKEQIYRKKLQKFYDEVKRIDALMMEKGI